MSGPFVRMIVNIAVMSASVFSRAFVAAYHQALQNAKAGGAGAAKTASRYGGMAQDEALKVLNLTKADLKDTSKLIAQYEKYFGQNEPAKGGSFYLQSKIYRAKEALEKAIEIEKTKAQQAKAESERARRGRGGGGGGESS